MPFADHIAAEELLRLRESAGHSPESLAEEIRLQAQREDWGQRGSVDAWTIRRIERTGYKPGPRIRFVLAHFFGKRPDEIWRGRERELVA